MFKKISLFIFLFLSNFSFSVVINYGSIAILPYKITSFSDNHKNLSTDVSGIITTRLAYSSNLTVKTQTQVLNTLKALKLNSTNYTTETILALSKILKVNYFIIGELVIKHDETVMNSKLVQIQNNTPVILSKAFFSMPGYTNFEIADLSEKTIKELSMNRIKLFFDTGEKLINKSDWDIMLVVDSSEKNKHEIDFLAQNVSNIYSDLNYINPGSTIRIGVTSFKNRADIYRAKMLDLTNNIIDVRRYLKDIDVSGGKESEGIDVSYGLYYTIVKTNWRAANRIIYLITSDKPSIVPEKYQFGEIIKKARNNNIVINILGTSEIPNEIRSYYKTMAEYTMGRYHDIIYNVSFYLDKKGKRQFIYKHHYLFMLKDYVPNRKWMLQSVFNDNNAIDITLGREILSINEVKLFLQKEGFKLSDSFDTETTAYDMDIDYIISNSMKSRLEKTFKKIPRIKVLSGTNQLYVYIGNSIAINYLQRNLRIGSVVLIGGTIKPTKKEPGFDFDPNSIILTKRQDLIANTLIRNSSEIGNFSKLYANSGIFDNKKWFIQARIISIENNR